MKKLSLVACGLLLSSSAMFAESNSVKEAFANGTTSGDITVYYESTDSKTGTDTGFTAGSVGVDFATDTFNGFSAAFGARAQHEFHEKNNTDYDGAFANDAVLHTAAIKYAIGGAFISVGRQAIDLEWLGDYNESVVAGITAIPDTTIILGYTDRQAEIGFDTTADFAEVTTHGAYVADVKYEGIEGVVLNPYIYSAPNVADFYGAKVTYDTDMFGVTGHYAQSSEDVAGTADGDIFNLEGRLNVVGIALAAGYIQTDKQGGVGSISAYGDNMSPLDDGENVYGTDATTYYGSASYSIADLTLTALYGTTEYNAANDDTDELNLIAEYAITEELSAAVTYVDYDDQGTGSDYKKLFANVTYAF